ncbi:ester cyclase [Cryptosporangium aurantiacum]|uniref:Predicted ester cyclase n=1 Tax=Cryptosporangium aurantiacum TaxID=134849 RepID=A0A1M7RM22_9ACTN|nr:ester cyclase [Cryptosporangium aurantiacum]SHN47239.1 Predicted ester cyclase [Cryptosporangium aurantiacum]
MSTLDLRSHYTNYIATLNHRRFDDLLTFVCEDLTYNDVSMTSGQYRALLEDDVRRIPDLYFEVMHLIVEGDVVACRLRFDCTPREPFRGLAPTGARVVFTEHVFYRFRDDRISQVWSLLDVEALQNQMRGWGH